MEYFDGDTSPLCDPRFSTKTTTTPNSSPSDFDITMSAMCHSIFQSEASLVTEQRLNQARLVLEYQRLCNDCDICLSRIQDPTREIETLQRENADLRLANTALLKLLTNSFNYLNKAVSGEFSPKSVMEPNRVQNVNVLKRDCLPKSISVRTNRYMNANKTNTDIAFIRRRLEKRQQKQNRNEMENEMYNQGTRKTELCNKWEETGTCPYGENCQFAHGIAELRPVIRHPKYKTQVCRTVLYGEVCPYGHRCHFRHSPTQQ